MTTKKETLPSSALNYLDGLLDKKSNNGFGLSEMLDTSNRAIKYAQTGTENPEIPPEYRKALSDHAKTREFKQFHRSLEDFVGRITRLRDDDRMGEVISKLNPEFNDQQWCIFLSSALGAYYDYGEHRKRIAESKKIARKIASSADELRKLITEFSSLHIDNQPGEFTSIQKLLSLTDHYGAETPKLEEWQKVRSSLLGDIPQNTISPSLQAYQDEMPGLFRLHLEEFDRDSHFFENIDSFYEQKNDELQHAWDMAPTIPNLLVRLFISAKSYKPSQSGIVGSALSRQKRNSKYGYIRTLVYILREEPSIEFSPNVMKALAAITNIILNDKDDILSPAEVRTVVAEPRSPSS